MATIDPHTALDRLSLTKFGGIKSGKRITSEGASDMCNFRIRKDGTLEKRSGYRPLYSLSGPVRGVWEGVINEQTYSFFVGNNKIYRLGPDDLSPTEIYYLTTDEQPVSFIFYHDRLFLFDGATVLVFLPALGTFSVTEGYVPLYGINWSPLQLGNVNEPRNLLNNRLRIHYLNTTASTTFRLPFTGKRIDSLRIDGVNVTSYSYTPGTSSFTISSELATGREVEIAFELDDLFSRRESILRGCSALLYKDSHRETVMTYGATAPGYMLCYSNKISDESLADCSKTYTVSTPLYFAWENRFSVGSTQHPIRAVCQSNEQVLVFNDNASWSVRYPEPESVNPRISLFHSGIGCSSRDGVVLCSHQPVTVHSGGISLLKIPSYDPNSCYLELLSEDVNECFDSAFLKSAILYHRQNPDELWVRDPNDSDGTVWILDLASKQWFRFDSIPANAFFEWNNQFCFSTDYGTIFVFDEAKHDDDFADINAFYRSHYFCFAPSELPKRSIRACLCVDAGETPISVLLETERCQKQLFPMGTGGDTPVLYDYRLSPGRFRFLRYTVTANDSQPCQIHFLSLSANH